eukprot:4366188-Pyramimonas_sp.AAC.1
MQAVEVEWVLQLQQSARAWDDVLSALTNAAAPGELLMYACPIIYWLHRRRYGDIGGLGALLVTAFAGKQHKPPRD